MFLALYTTVDSLSRLGGRAIEWCDGASFGALVLMAIVFAVAAAHLPKPRAAWAAMVFRGVFLLIYFLHRYDLDGDDFPRLAMSLLRSLVACHLFGNVVRLTILVFEHFLLRPISPEGLVRVNLVRALGSDRTVAKPCPEPAPPPAPPPDSSPPPPPRAVVLKQQAEAAQADYEAEIAALAGLTLDEDERETLTAMAKQRLLRKLSQEIESS